MSRESCCLSVAAAGARTHPLQVNDPSPILGRRRASARRSMAGALESVSDNNTSRHCQERRNDLDASARSQPRATPLPGRRYIPSLRTECSTRPTSTVWDGWRGQTPHERRGREGLSSGRVRHAPGGKSMCLIFGSHRGQFGTAVRAPLHDTTSSAPLPRRRYILSSSGTTKRLGVGIET